MNAKMLSAYHHSETPAPMRYAATTMLMARFYMVSDWLVWWRHVHLRAVRLVFSLGVATGCAKISLKVVLSRLYRFPSSVSLVGVNK